MSLPVRYSPFLHAMALRTGGGETFDDRHDLDLATPRLNFAGTGQGIHKEAANGHSLRHNYLSLGMISLSTPK